MNNTLPTCCSKLHQIQRYVNESEWFAPAKKNIASCLFRCCCCVRLFLLCFAHRCIFCLQARCSEWNDKGQHTGNSGNKKQSQDGADDIMVELVFAESPHRTSNHSGHQIYLNIRRPLQASSVLDYSYKKQFRKQLQSIQKSIQGNSSLTKSTQINSFQFDTSIQFNPSKLESLRADAIGPTAVLVKPWTTLARMQAELYLEATGKKGQQLGP